MTQSSIDVISIGQPDGSLNNPQAKAMTEILANLQNQQGNSHNQTPCGVSVRLL